MIVSKEDLSKLKELDYAAGTALLIDKPLTWSSFNVVHKLRNVLCRHMGVKKLKVGHAGTLDPLATGLLIICTGKFTKRIEEFQGQDKEYSGTIMLGSTRPSYDLETEIDQEYPTEHISQELIEQAMQTFVGDSMQQPPDFSAKQVNGRRAYESARKGRAVKLHPCPIHISAFAATDIRMPEVDFNTVCSKGTYIRSLAHDLGKSLDSGAHLSALRREASGSYRADNALSIDEVVAALAKDKSAQPS